VEPARDQRRSRLGDRLQCSGRSRPLVAADGALFRALPRRLWRVVVDDHEGADDRYCREEEPSEPAAAARQGVEVIALISHVTPCGWRLQEIRRPEYRSYSQRRMTQVTLGERKIVVTRAASPARLRGRAHRRALAGPILDLRQRPGANWHQKARRPGCIGAREGRVDMAEVGRWEVSTTRINPVCGIIASP
jgi:hypothetical protein